MAVYPADEFI